MICFSRALIVCLAVALMPAYAASAAEFEAPAPSLSLPPLQGLASPKIDRPAAAVSGQLTLTAELVEHGPEIPTGLVWRVFGAKPGKDGRFPLVATAKGGTSVVKLPPGSYLVHATFGRAGATKRIVVGTAPRRENLILDAGGLRLNAAIAGARPIAPAKLRFSIYEANASGNEEGPLIDPDVKPGAIVRLHAGTYHVVSRYGSVNAVIRADLRVEAGKLTEATLEHRAAQVTLKLARDHGGEAMADTSWEILTDSGDVLRKTVGAFASMVLAEGNYTAVAKNRGNVYQHSFTVEAGHDQEVEVLTSETGQPTGPVGDISD